MNFNKRIKKSFFSYVDRYSDIKGPFYVGRFSIIRKSRISSFSYVGNHTKIINANIGKFCSIAQNVRIGLGKHPTFMISTSPIFYSKNNPFKLEWVKENKFKEFEKITIGNDVWVGANAILLDGIKIGDGSIIAAGAIVTHNVPSFSIVGGCPAKLIRMRFDQETIDLIEESKWWNWPIEIIRENIDFFTDKEKFKELLYRRRRI